MRSFLAIAVLILTNALGLGQTAVTGTTVQDGTGHLLNQGYACFSPYNSSGVLTPIGGSTGPFCTPITNGAFSGSVASLASTGLNYQLVIQNQTAATISTINWLTTITGPSWSFDTLIVPISLNTAASAGGRGSPYWGCTAGANFVSTTAADPTRATWECTVINGFPKWFQTGNAPAPGPAQQATIPVVQAMIDAAISHISPTPPTSGTPVLKGNGEGGFAAALPGPDYIAPSAPASQTITQTSGQSLNTTGQGNGVKVGRTADQTAIVENPNTGLALLSSAGTQTMFCDPQTGNCTFLGTIAAAHIAFTGTEDGCAAFASGVLTSLGIPCGSGTGGGGFTGSDFEINAKAAGGSSSGTGTGMFTDGGKTHITTQLPFTAKTTNGTINTDLNGGLAVSVVCVGCDLSVPANSTEATSLLNVTDASNGNVFNATEESTQTRVHQNIGKGTPFGQAYTDGCMWGRMGNPSSLSDAGGSQTTCHEVLFSKTGGGVSAWDNWTEAVYEGSPNTNMFYMTSGQSFLHGFNINFMKNGDSIVEEQNDFYKEAATGFNDEAVKFFAIHLVDAGTTGGVVNSAPTQDLTTANDSVQLFVNGVGQGVNAIQDGGFLLYVGDGTKDITTVDSFVIDTAGGTNANLIHTTTTHSRSSWQATVLDGCGAVTHRDEKIPVICSVNVTVDDIDPALTDTVSVVDDIEGGMYETTRLTNSATIPPPTIPSGTVLPTGTGTKDIAIFLSGPVNAGAKFMIGGNVGTIGTFNNGVADPTTAPLLMQSWAIGGAPDSSHYYVVTNYKQQQQGPLQIQLPPTITSENFNTIPNCDNAITGAVSAPQGAFSPALNVSLVGGMHWVYSGDPDSTFNGTITNLVVGGDGSATWTAPGGACTAGSHSNNGTISVVGNQTFTLYCGAEVTAITNAPWQTGPFFHGSGIINLHTDPSSCTGAVGSAFFQPDRMEQEVQYETNVVTNSRQGVGNNSRVFWQEGGQGFSGVPVIRHDTVNNTDPVNGDYFHHGGQNQGSVFIQENVPNQGLWHSQYAPLNGNPIIQWGCPLENCSPTMEDVLIMSMPGIAPTFGGGVYWNGRLNMLAFGGSDGAMTVGFGQYNSFAGIGAPGPGHANLTIGPWADNANFTAISFTGTSADADFVGFIGSPGVHTLYHMLPADGFETWRWGTGSTGPNVGRLDATAFDYPKITQGGIDVCVEGDTTCGDTFGLLHANNSWSGQNVWSANTTFNGGVQVGTAGLGALGPMTMVPCGNATSSANFSPCFPWSLKGNYWNGSGSASDEWDITQTLGTGTNPTSNLAIAPKVGGTTGAHSVTLPNVGVTVYTVATLPAASSLPAGTMVEVSDASTFTPGTCTGSGSDFMIAITNGITWSCH